MLCQNCNENEANIKYTQIINGEKREMILCENCAKKLGIDSISFDMPINFSNFFGGFGNLIGDYETEFMPKLISNQSSKCKTCGLTYDEFVQTGKFGCKDCYETFQNRLDPILKTLHGETKYIGRKSNVQNKKVKTKIENQQSEKEDKINELKARLKVLIKEEKYEEAAKVRDQIKELE